MAHAFTVKSERGKPDSLTNPVKIAFTLTPVQSTHPYDPTARWVTDFPANGNKNLSFEFKSGYRFDTYTLRDGCCEFSADIWSERVLPGQRLELRSSSDPNKWSVPEAHSDQITPDRSPMRVLNKAGAT